MTCFSKSHLIFRLTVFVVLYYLLKSVCVLVQESKFYVAFLNVGQGDSIFINSPNYGALMVDTGPDYQANYLYAKRNIFPLCRLKYIFVTHYDKDHSGGLDRMKLYCPDATVEDNLSSGDFLKLGDVRIDILSPSNKSSNHSENDDSIIMLVRRRNLGILLTGDAGKDIIMGIVPKVLRLSGKLQVYKVPHHGSKYNTSLELMSLLKPNVCIISVGKNRFGHPSKETLDIMEKIKCKLYRTDVNGTIVIY